ncbi:hypothetical protein BT96DRAFT_1003677 [Gymnopus androsaceus JB14]|uniref:HTH CENPB-type domain-containing protein n=1 Tax=Gymnopus androsaceus JB14 TaxID=1447944 RepID=A0A6A4GUI0_9AGAR|nr:hypothetical protein BT96DRAFT_1003677 [Gymnopus androsaceus JB14]
MKFLNSSPLTDVCSASHSKVDALEHHALLLIHQRRARRQAHLEAIRALRTKAKIVQTKFKAAEIHMACEVQNKAIESWFESLQSLQDLLAEMRRSREEMEKQESSYKGNEYNITDVSHNNHMRLARMGKSISSGVRAVFQLVLAKHLLPLIRLPLAANIPKIPFPISIAKQSAFAIFLILLEKHEDIAWDYDVDCTTVSKILKDKERWLNAEDDARQKRRPSVPKYPLVKEEMKKWLMEVSDEYYGSLPDQSVYPWGWRSALSNGPFTDASLKEKALSIARSHGIDFQAPKGWVQSFKNRHNIWGGFWGGYRLAMEQRQSTTSTQSISQSHRAHERVPVMEYSVTCPNTSFPWLQLSNETAIDPAHPEDAEDESDSGCRQSTFDVSYLRSSAFESL